MSNKWIPAVLIFLLASSLFGAVVPQAEASTDKLVKQSVLLIRQSTETWSDRYIFPTVIAEKMNMSYTILNANTQDLTESLLRDGNIGKFSLICATTAAMATDLNATEKAILDDYEEDFKVAEVLLGPVSSAIKARYGVSSLGSNQGFLRLKWASNGLTNFMNVTMFPTTLGANTQVYAYGGSGTDLTNPVIWTYTDGNKTRVASSITGCSPYIGEIFSYWAPFWLGAKLSSSNKILKFYWSIDIDDVQSIYPDSLYLDGSDVEYMVTNLVNPLGFNPTLAIGYYDYSNRSMPTAFPLLYNALQLYKEKFDFTGHCHQFWQSTYQKALNIIRLERNALSSWGFEPTLYYMVPGGHSYSSVTAPAITDSPTWYVAQQFSYTSNTPPNVKGNSGFEAWSPLLFKVARSFLIDWNITKTSDVLAKSGQGTWDKYWLYQLEERFGASGYVKFLGGYRIEMTHIANWYYGRSDADAPYLQMIKNITGINILPIVPSRSWAIAEQLYFVRNFKFNATYNIDKNTLTYDIDKDNADARDRITIVLEGKAKPVDFHPYILKYDSNSTIITFEQQSSITIQLDSQETSKPFITSYQTSLLTALTYDGIKMTFTIDAPTGTTSTVKVYCGDKSNATSVWVNDALNTTWNYESFTKLLTLNLAHSGEELEVEINWVLEQVFIDPIMISSGAVVVVGIILAYWYRSRKKRRVLEV